MRACLVVNVGASLLLFLALCASTLRENAVSAAALSPIQVMEKFFDDYIAIRRSGAGGTPADLLADRAQSQSPFLTRELVQQVGAALGTPTRLRYDPLLCAQDIPER